MNNEVVDRFCKALLNDLDTARCMIEEGINIDYWPSFGTGFATALQFAIKRSNLRAVRFLVEQGADPNHYGWWLYSSPLYDAIIAFDGGEESYGILKLLLETGANCNTRCFDNDAARIFLRAFKSKSLECIKLLLDHGADIKAKTKSGKTALHYCAIQNSQVDVIRFLLDQGFDIECADDENQSALYYAVRYKNVEVCEFLLRGGANVNRRNSCGVPLLTLAVRMERIPDELVQVLLEYGADVTYKIKVDSALQIVDRVNYERGAARLLIQQMAKMEYSHLSYNECDRQIIENDIKYSKHYEKCMQELRDMKMAKFYKDVSVLDIFMESEKVQSGYAKDEKLVEALEKRAYGRRFPIYFPSLMKKFLAKVQRQQLQRTAAETLKCLFKFNDPLHIVNRKILGYMRDDNLTFLEI